MRLLLDANMPRSAVGAIESLGHAAVDLHANRKNKPNKSA